MESEEGMGSNSPSVLYFWHNVQELLKKALRYQLQANRQRVGLPFQKFQQQ
jgi:hypothetical protein